MGRARLDIVSWINFSTARKSIRPSFCSHKFGMASQIVKNSFAFLFLTTNRFGVMQLIMSQLKFSANFSIVM